MAIITEVLVVMAVLASPGQEARQTATPLTIGICDGLCMSDADPERPESLILNPLAIYQNQQWIKADIFQKWTQTEATISLQKALLSLLMNQTFFAFGDPGITFQAKGIGESSIWDSTFIGLTGTPLGQKRDSDNGRTYVMSNDRSICGTMGKTVLREKYIQYFDKRIKTLISKVAKSWATEEKQAYSYFFDPTFYQPPLFEKVLKCNIPRGKSCFWIHATVTYPQEKTRVMRDDEGCPLSGYYYAIIEARILGEPRILWEHADIDGDVWNNREYELLGICDANQDHKPEFILKVSGHEHMEYLFAKAQDGVLVNISSLEGGL